MILLNINITTAPVWDDAGDCVRAGGIFVLAKRLPPLSGPGTSDKPQQPSEQGGTEG